MLQSQEFLDIKQASAWATAHIGKLVTPSNIAYLINYGRIPKIGANGGTLIDKQDSLITTNNTPTTFSILNAKTRRKSARLQKNNRNKRKPITPKASPPFSATPESF